MVAGMITWIIFEAIETSWPSLMPATVVSLLAMIAGSYAWPQEEEKAV
jgi:SSS family solute:Na+ symporter